MALIETVLLILVQEAIYLIERNVFGFRSPIEGVSPPIIILSDGAAIFLYRMIYGFIPGAAVILFLGCAFRCRIHWIGIGIINLLVFVAMCAIWESQFHLLERLLYFHRPLYQRFMHFLLLACLFSPRLLLALRRWGGVLPLVVHK